MRSAILRSRSAPQAFVSRLNGGERHIGAPSEIVELTTDVSASPYYNADMAPVPAAGRKWGLKDIAALWVSMAACVTTYTLASLLINGGMNWWQAVLTIFLGNIIVLFPMVLNAHAGTRYGIPFPVYCRASFGLLGANIPAMLRALVACGWFGIQTWIGGWCIYKVLEVYNPDWAHLPPVYGIDINVAQLACFLGFWAVNIAIIYLGIESIRFLLNIKAPLLIALGLALLAWALHGASERGWCRSHIDETGARLSGEQFWAFFFPALTGAVGYWATLSLNIPDFTRYARSQRDQILGQAIGLPTTMALYSFIGAAVTSAAVVIYPNAPEKELWEPVTLISRFSNPAVLVVALFSLSLATLATNIAANVVSPANDFAHLAPKVYRLPHRRLDYGDHRHSDSAVEAVQRSVGLHLYLANRVFIAARCDRRHINRRLLCDSKDVSRFAGALSKRWTLLVHRRRQHRGHDRADRSESDYACQGFWPPLRRWKSPSSGPTCIATLGL